MYVLTRKHTKFTIALNGLSMVCCSYHVCRVRTYIRMSVHVIMSATNMHCVCICCRRQQSRSLLSTKPNGTFLVRPKDPPDWVDKDKGILHTHTIDVMWVAQMLGCICHNQGHPAYCYYCRGLFLCSVVWWREKTLSRYVCGRINGINMIAECINH